MPTNNPPAGTAEVVAALKAQLTELQPQLLNLGQIVALTASLNRLRTLLSGLAAPAGTTLTTKLDAAIAKSRLIGGWYRVRWLLDSRPDSGAMVGAVAAVKGVRGGPAAATASQ